MPSLISSLALFPWLAGCLLRWTRGSALNTCFSLLLRHKHTAAFLNRPHGQHAVVLAEDAHRFTAFRGERDDLSGVNPSSRQIYLTFPAESSFTEEDVTSHFR